MKSVTKELNQKPSKDTLATTSRSKEWVLVSKKSNTQNEIARTAPTISKGKEVVVESIPTLCHSQEIPESSGNEVVNGLSSGKNAAQKQIESIIPLEATQETSNKFEALKILHEEEGITHHIESSLLEMKLLPSQNSTQEETVEAVHQDKNICQQIQEQVYCEEILKQITKTFSSSDMQMVTVTEKTEKEMDLCSFPAVNEAFASSPDGQESPDRSKSTEKQGSSHQAQRSDRPTIHKIASDSNLLGMILESKEEGMKDMDMEPNSMASREKEFQSMAEGKESMVKLIPMELKVGRKFPNSSNKVKVKVESSMNLRSKEAGTGSKKVSQ